MSNRTTQILWMARAALVTAFLWPAPSQAAPAGQPVDERPTEKALPWKNVRQADDPLAALVRSVLAQPDAHSYAYLSGAVAREIFKDLDGDGDLRELEERMDDYARDLQNALVKADGGVEARLAAFNRFIYEKKLKLKSAGPVPKSEERADHYFLHRVLKKKSGVCLGLGLVTLDLGERIGWPMAPVHAPLHLYVRYGKGRDARNLETTLRGATFDEGAFIQRNGLDLKRERARGYFVADTKASVLSDLLNAAAYFSAKDAVPRPLTPARAVLAARLSVELRPEAYNNWDTLAEACAYAGDHAMALEAFERCLALEPPAIEPYGRTYWSRRHALFKARAAGQESAADNAHAGR